MNNTSSLNLVCHRNLTQLYIYSPNQQEVVVRSKTSIPLDVRMDDTSVCGQYRPMLSKVMEVYDQKVVVLQCGAESLAGDKLGTFNTFNLSVMGHADCVACLISLNVPLMVLGCGGYTINNVASSVGVMREI